MIEILTEWTDALRVPLHHKRHLQYQVKNKTFFFCWSKSNRCLYSSHRRLLRFCFLFTFVNRLHCFSVGKLYRYFRSIRFSSYGLCLWNFIKSISLLYRFRSRWQYICLNFICQAEWIVCWSRYVTDYHYLGVRRPNHTECTKPSVFRLKIVTVAKIVQMER